MRARHLWVIGLGVLAAAIVLAWSAVRVPSSLEDAPETDLRLARAALAGGRFPKAEQLAREALESAPDNIDALLIAGEAATRQERFDDALRYYARVKDDGNQKHTIAVLATADLQRHLGRLSEAERSLREVLAREPHNAVAHDHLAFVLNAAGRRWEATPHLLSVVGRGEFTVQQLLLLGNTERLAHHVEYLGRCRAARPDDPLPLLGIARVHLERRQLDEARSLLDRSLAGASDLVEAQIQLGWLLQQSGPEDAFLAWHAAIGAAAESHPDLWAIRGRWFQDHAHHDEAVRCYWESVRRDPDHRVAVYQLGQLLRAGDRSELAQEVLDRAERLQQLADLLDAIEKAPGDTSRIHRAAELTADLQRLWEAAAWAQVALSVEPRTKWAVTLLERIRPRLGTGPPGGRTIAADELWARADLGDRSLPALPQPGARPASIRPSSPGVAAIRFLDAAASAGVEFTYFNSHDPASEGMRMFEFTGGGVAAVDFDCDGWPDLHFTQGCVWPADPRQQTHLDRLFRNLGDGRAADVTLRAGVGDNRYSQGVAVGDVNGDGFPDLYVANIGLNRLYVSNGDGTFSDATVDAGLTSAVWTTSCAVVDVGGDGLPDLYDVNYLAGEGVFSHICQKDGISRACNPTVFAAEEDRLLLNGGDGTFRDVTEASGIVTPNGNGLGIVAADFDDDRRLDVFIANDTTANFLFLNQRSGPEVMPRFNESALLSGVAFDGDGRAQACMGVGCADADGDGRLDLFITNYYQESNTLYRQSQPGLFIDGTAPAGLKEPSFNRLGFGTQFLDADLDGRQDLVLVNGHVDDFSHEGTPYRMRPQFFANAGGGRFVELFADALGPWFAREQLGRGLARLDWDRDGRDDFAVSHLDTPAALLVNQSEPSGGCVALRLVGVHAARDAIATTVTARAADRTLTAQLTAGDGYQASNERRLTFGLGAAGRLEDVVVRWPGGVEQRLGPLAAGAEYVLVEGQTPRFVRALAK